MPKYILNKYQIQRLINGKEIIDINGRKFIASIALRNKLSEVDYEEFNVVFEKGKLRLDIRSRENGD